MSKTEIKGWVAGNCTHPEGPESGVYAPEICCPDELCEYGEITTVDCNESCTHHISHKEE